MSYQPANILNLLPEETGYQLDTNDYIAVSRRAQDPTRCQANHVSLVWKARWVDALGKAMNDYGGKPVEWEHGYSALQSGFANGTISAAQFAQEGLDLVLQGGPTNGTPDVMHPDLGIRAKIMAVKAVLALGTL